MFTKSFYLSFLMVFCLVCNRLETEFKWVQHHKDYTSSRHFVRISNEKSGFLLKEINIKNSQVY